MKDALIDITIWCVAVAIGIGCIELLQRLVSFIVKIAS